MIAVADEPIGTLRRELLLLAFLNILPIEVVEPVMSLLCKHQGLRVLFSFGEGVSLEGILG